MRYFSAFFASLFLALASGTASAQTICVYDPAGRTGFAFDWMEAWKLNAAGQGVTVELKPYTDEETAVNDFTAGKCDGVAATGVRLQKFNPGAYTLEALAGIPNYSMLKSVLNTVQTDSRYASMFTSGEYETAGVYPLGAVYAFVTDRSIDDITDFAGKRIAAMEYDATSLLVVQHIGGVAVPVNLSSFSGAFNNKDVAATFVPASAYTPFELWHGLEGGGAVVKYPLLQVTLQVVIKPSAFPANFGTAARTHAASQFDVAMQTINKAEGEIKASYWSEMDPAKVEEFERAMQELRLQLRDKGSYDANVLRLLRLARCNADSSRWECTNPVE